MEDRDLLAGAVLSDPASIQPASKLALQLGPSADFRGYCLLFPHPCFPLLCLQAIGMGLALPWGRQIRST